MCAHTQTHIHKDVTLVYWEYSYHRKSQNVLYFPAGGRKFSFGHVESEMMEGLGHEIVL